MSLFTALRDGHFCRNNKARKARRRLGQAWSSPSRTSRTQMISLVEMLESRQLLSGIVTTDQDDYAPGSVATFTASNDANPGLNFAAGEVVRFQVTRTDGIEDFPSGNLPWGVQDNYTGSAYQSQDANGSFWVYADQDPTEGVVKTTWNVEEQYAGAKLLLTAVGQTSTATATKAFTDAAGTWSVGFPSYSISEGGGTVQIPIYLSRTGNGTTSVSWSTINASAQSGDDFTATSGSVTATGSISGLVDYVTVPLINDSVLESLEYFRVALSNPTNGTVVDLNKDNAYVYIYDDDALAANADTYNATEDIGFTSPYSVLANDGVPVGTFAELYSNPSKGYLSYFSSSGTFQYIPNLNANGTDSFQYQRVFWNGSYYVYSTPTTVTINISPVNDSPFISLVSNNGPVTYGNSTTISISAGDVDGPSLSYAFDFDNDGIYEIGPQAGNQATWTFTSAGLKTVGVRVIDGLGAAVTSSTVVNVNPKMVTASLVANSKVFDGTISATLSSQFLSGVLPADLGHVVLNIGAANFSDENVGIGKTVTASGLALAGTAAGNYALASSTLTTTSDITPRGLLASITPLSKTYDGSSSVTLISTDFVLSGLVGADSFTVTQTSGAYSIVNVGLGLVSASLGAGDFTAAPGTQAGNYSLPTYASGLGQITAKVLTPIIAADSKTYDGSTTATLSSQTVIGVVPADVDDVSLTVTAANFDSASAGTGKTVTATGLGLSGAAAGNYTLGATTSVTTTADINKATPTVSVTINGGTYNGSAFAATAAAVTGVGAITLASFGDPTLTYHYYAGTLTTPAQVAAATELPGGAPKNAGLYTVVAHYASSNANYTSADSAPVNFTIDVRAVTVTADAKSKTYGTADPGLTYEVTSGALASGDGFSGALTRVAGKDVGSYAIQQGTLALSSNYTLTYIGANLDITKAVLNVSAHGVDRVYDATTGATVTLTDDHLGSDVVALAYASASFADKNVGTGKTVSVSGISISGADAGNYTVNTTATAYASITPLHITGAFTASNKVYDGSTAATVLTWSTVGDVGGVSLSGGMATFGDRNVGINKVVTVTGATLTGADAANYVLDSVATTTAEITALHITGSFTAASRIYDGTNAASVSTHSLSGALGGDSVSLTGGSATFDTKNVGINKTVTLAGADLTGTDAGNYVLDSVVTATADITALHITGGFTAADKTYDASDAATLTGRSLNGVLAGDTSNVSLSGGTATFSDKNVGTNKTVTGTGFSLAGSESGNYLLTSVATTTADIIALAIIGSITASDKVYDGTDSATIAGRTLAGVISGDVVSYVGGTATFSDKNVGTNKTVTGTGLSLAGADAGNYTVNATATTTANITPRALIVSAASVNKVYDGTTAATVILGDDRVADDVLTASYASASFADRNVDTGKTVTVSGISISGTDAGNYTVNTTATATADITKKALTVSVTGVNKVYDGNNTATVTLADDRVSGDSLSTAYAAAFNDKNVGIGKLVNVTGISISGADAGNYTVNSTASTTADVTPRALIVSAAGVNKVYDGTTAATVILADDRVAGDVLTASYASASFADRNVGTGKTVTVGGLSLTGADAGNYTANPTATTTADITARAITIAATADTRTYDGTTASTAAPTIVSGALAAGDTGIWAQAFDSRNVGNRVLTPSGTVSDGNSGQNYTVTYATAAGTITARVVTGGFTAAGKVYDGQTTAQILSRSLGGQIFGDGVSLGTSGNAAFADADAGTGKTVTGTGFALTGADASNYVLASSTLTTTADIARANQTVTWANPADIVYGTALSGTQLNATVAGVSGGSATGTVTYTPAAGTVLNAGVGQILHVDVAATTNYNAVTKSVTINVGQFTPTVSVTAPDVTYDGMTHGATASAVTGVNGAALGSASSFVYYAGVGILGTNLGGTAPTDAGTYTVVAHFTSVDTNYADAESSPMTFTIAKATSTTVAIGDAFVYDGTTHAGGSSLVTGAGGLSTTATLSYSGDRVNAGAYTVIAAYAGDANHFGSSNSATITIAKATQTISWATPSAINYGTPLSGLQLNAVVTSGDGTLTYSPGAGAVLSAGSQALTVTAGETANYNEATKSVTLVVNPYNFGGFLAPLASNKTYGLNRTIPIKFQLKDAGGAFLTSLSAVTSLEVTNPNSVVVAHYQANTATIGAAGNTTLRYDTTDNQYIFNWQTPKAGDGQYAITLKLADGTTRTMFVMLSKNGSGALMTDSSTGVSSDLNGHLLAGDIWLYVDGAGFTADELSRVGDAVEAINASTAPYGASVVLVGSPDLANFTMSFDTQSVLGTAREGLLGVTDDAGDIVLLTGWDWYAGASPAAIGVGQFDLQTVITHEIGHALGLGHSTETSSVMNATLATGQVKRAVTTQDLKIDEDGDDVGAHGLHAVVPAPPNSSIQAGSVSKATQTGQPGASSSPVITVAPSASSPSPRAFAVSREARKAHSEPRQWGRPLQVITTSETRRAVLDITIGDAPADPASSDLHDTALEHILAMGYRAGRRSHSRK